MNTKEFMNILPSSLKTALNGKDLSGLQEIRIKVNKPLIIQKGSGEEVEKYLATSDDVKTILQRISNYSIYAYEEEIKQGFITIKGGHRVGICGSCVIQDEGIKMIKDISSLNIRFCREIIGCSDKLMPYIIDGKRIINTIIISPPKCGKTTLLRDMVRNISDGISKLGFDGMKVCVVDERSEIGACYSGIPQMRVGIRTDILDNCPKSKGIMLAIRSMSPDVIVCDEIGTRADMESLLMALNCGVSILTTIHGEGIQDLHRRAVFNEIVQNKVFKRAIVLSGKKGVGTIEGIYDLSINEDLWGK